MTRARCPHCATVFRATPEQLNQRAGKVRCGSCHKVFNSLDNLIDETAAALAAEISAQPTAAPDKAQAAAEPLAPASDAAAASGPATVIGWDETGVGAPAREVAEEATAASTGETTADASPVAAADGDAAASGGGDAPPPEATVEESAVVAVRETRDAPGYSKWAEGTLSAPPMHFDEPRGAPWLAVVVAVALILMLGAQLTLHYRTDIAARWPGVRPWLEEACLSLECSVPYPRQMTLISLDASELQIDPTRGNLLVLHMTLRNRAEFAQEYPAIELTLTNLQDATVVRRILSPADYLPPTLEGTKSFAAQSELGARLYIDSKDSGAVGYRLYVFYPSATE